jgi:hypothetical protein
VTDFLDEKRDEIEDRLAELRPLVEEYSRLQAAAAALRGIDGSAGAGVLTGVPVSSPREASAGTGSDGEAPGTAEEAPLDRTPAHAPASAPGLARRGPGRPRGSTGSGGGSAGAKASEAGGDGVSSSDGTAQDETSETPASQAEPRAINGPRRAGRPKGSGTRAAEALRIVREHPGVTIPELADRMGIKQNYLYRVLPELVQEGKVAKQGRGWHPRAA